MQNVQTRRGRAERLGHGPGLPVPGPTEGAEGGVAQLFERAEGALWSCGW